MFFVTLEHQISKHNPSRKNKNDKTDRKVFEIKYQIDNSMQRSA